VATDLAEALTLQGADVPLTSGERALLPEWLGRLAVC